VDFLIDRKPGTSVTFHSTGPKAQEEVATLLQKNFPELAEALAAQGGSAQASGNLNRNEHVFVNVASRKFKVTEALLPTGSSQAVDTKSDAGTGTPVPNANNPITPEAGGNWRLFCFLLAVLILAALIYLLHHH
jgi:hypothetical protein